MADRKLMEKQFKELDGAIERLKEVERELGELKPPDRVFDSQIESLRSKLKQPQRVDEVEQELTALRKSMEEYVPAKPPPAERVKERTAPPPPPRPPSRQPDSLFPPELAELYSDATLIGSGGFARVFRAKRKSDGKEVAVKVPISLDSSTGKSFVREISAWQRLSHRNIVKLYDMNVLPTPYLEMELCQKRLDEMPKPLDVKEAAGIVFHLAEGLKHAHSNGTVHRDLKPQNILLQSDVPKIADWGLSKISAESTSSTRSTFSPVYAAPEQLASQQFGKPDHRTDIYQMGVIFYELVTGEMPSKADNITELMAQIINQEPPRPSAVNPEAAAVEPMIMKCLRKEMRDRYQSVDELQKDLAEYLEMEYKDSLKKSQGDMRRSGYYCAELFLLHVTRGDLAEALKYAADLDHYAGEGSKSDLDSLIAEFQQRSKDGLGIPAESVERAAMILHQVRMGR